MAARNQDTARLEKPSTVTEVPRETQGLGDQPSSFHTNSNNEKDEHIDNLEYPGPWRFEKWFIGGYTQNKMLKFKRPKTMYTATNLFAGECF